MKSFITFIFILYLLYSSTVSVDTPWCNVTDSMYTPHIFSMYGEFKQNDLT